MHFTVRRTVRSLPAVGGARARASLSRASRAVLFPESGGAGRSVVVVSAAVVSVREDQPGSDAPGRRAARRTDGVSAGK